MAVEQSSAEIQEKEKALLEYRRKLIEHRDIDASLKSGSLNMNLLVLFSLGFV